MYSLHEAALGILITANWCKSSSTTGSGVAVMPVPVEPYTRLICTQVKEVLPGTTAWLEGSVIKGDILLQVLCFSSALVV